MKTEKKFYDFAFVLGGLPYISYPTGGDNVVFQLCKGLKSNGYSVGLIVIKNPLSYLSGKNFDKKLKVDGLKDSMLRKILFNRVSYKVGSRILLKRVGVDYDFSILDGIDIFFFRSPNKIKKIGIKRIIATHWSTAKFTSDYVNENIDVEGYYLAQHSEDDISFSGKFHKYAADTYNLKNLRKIVTNKGMLKRFEIDYPLLFNVGIDSIFLNKTMNDKENIILFPLRNGEHKGANYMLESVEELHNTLHEWKFSAFGNYNDPIPQYIDFHHRAKTSDLVTLYAKSKIFVLPSLVEGFSLVVLEAMKSGCAVVSTNCGGVDEYGIEGENILFVPIKDSKSITKAVLNLIKDEQLLNGLSDKGAITAEKYSYYNMCKEFISLFKES